MATYKSVILTGKNDIKRDGTTNVKIRIWHKNKPAYIPTELYVIPSQMNNKTGLAESGDNVSHINLIITQWLLKCRTVDMTFGEKRNRLSALDIKKLILNKEEYASGIDFYAFTNQLVASTKVNETSRQYHFCAERLKAFAGPSLYFSDINLNFLLRFEAFLYANGARNGIINYMTTFRAIFNKARHLYNNEDTGQISIPHYPFSKYQIPKRKPHSKDHVLTKDEMKQLMNYKPINAGEELAQDMFLLMFYLIGIEAKDLFFLSKAIKGRINYIRFKTERPYSIKIEPQAQAIIDKYANQNYLLNFQDSFSLSTSFLRKINNNLSGNKAAKIKGIFSQLGIPKKVSTKWARHTWATFARNDCRIDKDDVALCLGHQDSDNPVTDMYVKYDYSIIDDSNRKVISFLLE